MTDCTERSEGQAGMPGMSSVFATPVAVAPNGINSVKRLGKPAADNRIDPVRRVEQETT